MSPSRDILRLTGANEYVKIEEVEIAIGVAKVRGSSK
jgi:hypothetical protein